MTAGTQVETDLDAAEATDDLGSDILSRSLYGTRASLEVGLLSVLLALVVGVPLGLLAGWWNPLGGVISRLTDLLLAFPFLIIAVGLAAICGPSLTGAAIALGVAQVPTMVRVVRAETLRLRDREFVLAARSMDASVRGSSPPTSYRTRCRRSSSRPR
jgi:peptide/nickel transport system permease protein